MTANLLRPKSRNKKRPVRGGNHAQGRERNKIKHLWTAYHRETRKARKMRLLLGGSPCTHWSIAQTKNRETKPEGIGWELFLNYRIARDKFKPDYFLYENNKSMSAAIREQITAELGVEPVLINSALVSAQSRQRLYWLGRRMPDGTYTRVEVEQPKDRGILLRDILDSGEAWREKGYTLRASIGMHGGTSSVLKTIKEPGKFAFNGKAEPIRIGTIESGSHTTHDSKPFRVYSPDGKVVTQQGEAGGYGAKTGLYAVPMRVGDMPNARGKINGSQSGRVYDVEGKGVRCKPDQTEEAQTVLSMYDGMSCGHIALDKLGAKVERYYATEIDKWAIKTTQANYPETVQLGDAFAVRADDWRLKDD